MKFVQDKEIDVFIIIQVYGRMSDEYQSMFIRMYDYDGMLFESLNENMYIESEFYVLG